MILKSKPQKSNQRHLRHCMLVHAYYPLGETRVEREALALAQRGYQVDVICLRNEGELQVDKIDGITIYRLPMKRLKWKNPLSQFLEYMTFFILASFRLLFLHWETRYDIVQIHNLPDFLVFAAAFPKLMGARLILDIHDLMPEFFASKTGRSMDSLTVRLLIWQEQLSCRFADHVITVSEHWRKRLISRGVPEHKCSVVMNVADESIFYMRDDYQPSAAQRFRFIYHGTLVYRYGLDLAIQAIDLVKVKIPNIHLTILGKGDYADALIQMVQERKLEGYVSIHNDLLPAQDLPEIILSSRLGIVPYRDDPFTDELLPTKLMEYAALGLPAIAARTTAIESYFRNTMVEFFEPGNADDLASCILSLYNSPERLGELAAGCVVFNERYNWTKNGAEYLDLVRRLISRNINGDWDPESSPAAR
jgi:glycosyltransferase involved in cell wall biosynthesis